jgi:hypothetical protein
MIILRNTKWFPHGPYTPHLIKEGVLISRLAGMGEAHTSSVCRQKCGSNHYTLLRGRKRPHFYKSTAQRKMPSLRHGEGVAKDQSGKGRGN